MGYNNVSRLITMGSDTTMFPTRRSNLITQTLQDEVVILDRDGGNVHQLNVTASYIWEQCDGRTSPEAIAERLAEAFGRTPGEVLDDVMRTLDNLRTISLLEPDSRTPTVP
jgi:hypothetical protein